VSQRILIIEPSRIIRTLLDIHLRQAGHRVIMTDGPQEGLRVLRGLDKDIPDLIFLAVHAQGREDYQVMHYVQKHTHYAHTTMVVMLTQEESERELRTLARTHSPCLIKPFRVQDALSLAFFVGSAVLPGAGGVESGERR
jgi:CheY-like chemotaxis protein